MAKSNKTNQETGMVVPIESKARNDAPAVKEKGRGGINNFGNNTKASIKTEADKQLVRGFMSEVVEAYHQPRVKSDEELAERLSGYLVMCAERGQVPTVEEMAMSTGYSLSTVWDWENGRNKGFSSDTSFLIKKAKDVIKTFDAKMVLAGKINPVAYFFRAKNYYGMKDQQEHILTPSNVLGAELTEDELRARYVPAQGITDGE